MNVLENESKWKDNEKEKMKKVASDHNGEENAEKTRKKKQDFFLKLDLSLVPTNVLDQLV